MGKRKKNGACITSVYFKPYERAEVERMAAEQGRSKSDVIRRCVRAVVEAEHKEQSQSPAAPAC